MHSSKFYRSKNNWVAIVLRKKRACLPPSGYFSCFFVTLIVGHTADTVLGRLSFFLSFLEKKLHMACIIVAESMLSPLTTSTGKVNMATLITWERELECSVDVYIYILTYRETAMLSMLTWKNTCCALRPPDTLLLTVTETWLRRSKVLENEYIKKEKELQI